MTHVSNDDFLGGRLRLKQPIRGYRAGQDPVLLAAATPIQPGQRFVDLGCGVGTIAHCLFERVGRANISGIGVEQDTALAALAKENAMANGLSGFDVRAGDIFDIPPEPADWVISNPPFFDANAGRVPTHEQRKAGRHSQIGIMRWISCMMGWVRPRGYLGLVLNTAQIPQAMAALSPAFGGILMVPILGRAGKMGCERCLLFARQGSRSPFQVASPLIIRDMNGDLTTQTHEVLSGGQALSLPILK